MNKSRLSIVLAIAVAIIATVVGLQIFGTYKDTGRERWPLQHATQTGRSVVAFGDANAFALANSLGHQELINHTTEAMTALESTAAAKERAAAVAELGANIVVVSIGAGDLASKTPLEETLANLEATFKTLQSKGSLVAFVPPAIPPGVGDNYFMALEDVCRRNGVLWVADASDLAHHLKP